MLRGVLLDAGQVKACQLRLAGVLRGRKVCQRYGQHFQQCTGSVVGGQRRKRVDVGFEAMVCDFPEQTCRCMLPIEGGCGQHINVGDQLTQLMGRNGQHRLREVAIKRKLKCPGA